MARHGTARHGTARHNEICQTRFFNMKKLLLKIGRLKIGRKIDLFYFNLLSIHGDLRGKYPLYRVLERLLRRLLSLPFRRVPGLKLTRMWLLVLLLIFHWPSDLDILWFGWFGVGIWLSDRIAHKIVEWLRHFRWFRRINGE
jgi:hypothetical protein